jgi:hypothetical protein
MKILSLILAAMCLTGCCANPGVFGQVKQTVNLVQSFYDPLLAEFAVLPQEYRAAMVAADTTLALAAALQAQWCPDPKDVEQMRLQAALAAKLADKQGGGP